MGPSLRALAFAALLVGCAAGGGETLLPDEDAGGGVEDLGAPATPYDAGSVGIDAWTPTPDVARMTVDDSGPTPPRDAPVAAMDAMSAGGGFCAPCATNEQCAAGGLCVRSPAGEMLCAVPCEGGNACAAGRRCVGVQTNVGVIAQCVPSSGTCSGAVPVDAGVPLDRGAPSSDLGPPTDVPGGPLTAGERVVSVGTRSVLLYVPARWRAGAAGLVALHGNGDTASNFLRTSGLMGVADSEGVALALPMAIAGSAPMGVDWDAYTRPASSNPDLRLVADTRALLVGGGVDARRVFLAGQSQGGYLAFYAGMTFSTLFGAVNVSAAGDPMPGLGLAAMATRRIPVDLLTGDGDFAIANIRSTRDDLQRRGFDVRYTELAGVGHCCPLSTRTGTAPAMWLWLSARPLP
jgi:hypothetical protein